MRSLLLIAAMSAATTIALGADPDAGTFLVRERGCALLGADGQEIARLESKANAAGALSPDGRWVVFLKSEPNAAQNTMIVQSRANATLRDTLSLAFGASGSSFLPIWSRDSQRILVCEQRRQRNKSPETACCVLHLADKTLDEVTLPKDCWPSDWSADGKRLLTTVQSDDDSPRIARVNFDGTGAPEYITAADEVAYHGRLSPDGTRILCMVGSKAQTGAQISWRLRVINLSTGQLTTIDEPGATSGHCWNSDGSQIAYTWQRPLEKPVEVSVRETFLITCTADGSHRKTITSRKYDVPPNSSGKEGVIYFFEVLDWR